MIKRFHQAGIYHADLNAHNILLNDADVAVVPGTAFGAPGYIRLSFACSMGELEESLQRIGRFDGLTVDPIQAPVPALGYRNRVEFTVGLGWDRLLLYVASSVLATLFATYCAFWCRTAGLHVTFMTLLIILFGLTTVAIALVVGDTSYRSAPYIVLPLLSLTALGFRALAYRGLRRVDWCAVRPARARGRSIR